MATLNTDEANLIDVETVNWRIVVYPLLAVLIILLGGFGYYYYTLDQRIQLESTARAALLEAKTPEEFIKVADQYPSTTQATLALMSAATASFAKHDYKASVADYQRIVDNGSTDASLRESAQLGVASSLETDGKIDDAITNYLAVAQLGTKSPYAPFAYYAAARLYEEKGDKDGERKILSQVAGLDANSPFVKQAQMKLNELNAAAKPAASTAVSTTPVQIPPATPSPK